jgi:hypothetical protein
MKWAGTDFEPKAQRVLWSKFLKFSPQTSTLVWPSLTPYLGKIALIVGGVKYIKD